jgi:hypothetical protein
MFNFIKKLFEVEKKDPKEENNEKESLLKEEIKEINEDKIDKKRKNETLNIDTITSKKTKYYDGKF